MSPRVHRQGFIMGLSIGLFSLNSAHADVLNEVLAVNRLRCGVYADVPPFSSPDPVSRNMVGMDVDLCTAVAAELGVSVELVPLSVESRIPELQMGRVDMVIANLAYTRRRAAQIDFSYSYYLGREELVVYAKDSARSPADFRGLRISAARGSTSEQSILVNYGVAVAYQDTGAAYLALQQHKVQGLVTNSITAHKLILQVAAAGVHLSLLKQPMAFEPVAIGMRKGEYAFVAKVDEVLTRLDERGCIDDIWSRWLGRGTVYNMPRGVKVTDIAKLDFQPLP
jgi:polar amino acid transport system substrate-binding protein